MKSVRTRESLGRKCWHLVDTLR